MKKNLIILVVNISLLFSLSSCKPSDKAVSTALANALKKTQIFQNGIETAFAQTQPAKSTNTQTVTPSPTISSSPTTTYTPTITTLPTPEGNLINILPDASFRTENAWYGWESSPLTLVAPFSIKINFIGDGPFQAISLFGKLRSGSEWWEGINVMYVAAKENRVRLEIRDGKTEDSLFSLDLPSSIKPGSPFSIIFLDANGKSFDIRDEENNLIINYNISQFSGIEMPDGLFPGKLLYVGVLVSPNAELNIFEFSMEKLDDYP